jgi:indolepyruvate ferredoxin oxidoreductase, beta subunit
LRGLRRRSLRFQVEHARLRAWLTLVQELAIDRPDLALEVARAQRLIKGYGDTHARGWRSYERLIGALPQLRARADGPATFRELSQAALADDSGQALDARLARAVQ